MRDLGRILIVAGGMLALLGLLLTFAGRTPLGRLPGDILVRRPGFTFYFPLMTSILVSVALSLILWLFRR